MKPIINLFNKINKLLKMSKKEIKERMRKQLDDDAYLTQITRTPFDKADINHNGTIEMKELKACMIEIAEGMGSEIPKDKVIKDEFYKLDTNKNNTLEFSEFKVFVKKCMLNIIDAIPDN